MIFNNLLIPKIERKMKILHEVIRDRCNQVAIYITINKKLISKIANQAKVSLTAISTNISNYYDYITLFSIYLK